MRNRGYKLSKMMVKQNVKKKNYLLISLLFDFEGQGYENKFLDHTYKHVKFESTRDSSFGGFVSEGKTLCW